MADMDAVEYEQDGLIEWIIARLALRFEIQVEDVLEMIIRQTHKKRIPKVVKELHTFKYATPAHWAFQRADIELARRLCDGWRDHARSNGLTKIMGTTPSWLPDEESEELGVLGGPDRD